MTTHSHLLHRKFDFYSHHREVQKVTPMRPTNQRVTICTDGLIYLLILSQGTTDMVNGFNGFPVSSDATYVAFLGDDIVFVRIIALR